MSSTNTVRVVVLALLMTSAYAEAASAQAQLAQSAMLANNALLGANLGFAVAIEDNLALVGMPGSGGASGIVYVFTGSGGAWTATDMITDPDPAPSADAFGSSIALLNHVAVIGAPGHNGHAGAAWLVTYPVAAAPRRLVPPAAPCAAHSDMVSCSADTANFCAWTGGACAVTTPTYFGTSVAISTNWVAVGGPSEPLGAAGGFVVFTRAGTNGVQIRASSAGDLFGQSVALAQNADVLVVGAPEDSQVGTHAGAVHAYHYVTAMSTWLPNGDVLPTSAGSFGQGVALSPDGLALAIGAPSTQSTVAASAVGAVFVYTRSNVGVPWPFVAQRIGADVERQSNYFGQALAFSTVMAPAYRLVVGAYRYDTSMTDVGSAFLFDVPAMGAPTMTAHYFLSAPAANDELGFSVAISSDTVLAGVPRSGASGSFAAAFALPWDNGMACTTTPERCGSGHCAGGVCCNTACDNGCGICTTGTCVSTLAACTACGTTGRCGADITCHVMGDCDMGPPLDQDTGVAPGDDGGLGMDGGARPPIVHISGCKCAVASARGSSSLAAITATLPLGILMLALAARRRVRREWAPRKDDNLRSVRPCRS